MDPPKDFEESPHTTSVRNALPERSFARVSLVIYFQDGAEIVPLAPRARLVLGRAPEADISIPEATLSRQHACVELIGEEVWIEDLDSANGTRVNGQLIQRVRLRPGDDVVLGAVAVSVHTSAHHAHGLEQHSRFLVTLEEELRRARTFQHRLALLLVREDEPQLFSEWSARVRQVLGPVDRIALQGAGTVEILLPETDRPAAEQRARLVRAAGGSLRCGIATYPGCGEDVDELLAAALEALDSTTKREPIKSAEAETRETSAPRSNRDEPWIGGAAMHRVYQTVEQVAHARLPVLLCGETGSGKEVVARALHAASPRRDKPMCFINCGAIPRDLVQSVLFGHERGTFTGADQQRKGVFEQAHGSTLLLDEVGELPPEAQVSLLRVLETDHVARIGSGAEIPVDVRVLSATHRDLESMCDAGEFRRDLLYRLNAITIRIPPLRHRPDELAPLAAHFLQRACHLGGLPAKSLGTDALLAIERYPWPGNVRELRNAIERAVLVGNGPVVRAIDLPERVRNVEPLGRAATTEAPTVHAVAAAESPSSSPTASSRDFRSRVRAYESTLLRRALERTGWNKTQAAEELQMPLRTLMHKISVLGLTPREGSRDDTAPALVALDDEGVSQPFRESVQRYEASLLVEALVASGWNKARAARRLGVPLSTLANKIRSYELDAGSNDP